MAPKNDRQLQMRVSDEFLSKVDEWRRKQPDLPPRTEAIRRMVDLVVLAKVAARSVDANQKGG